MLSITNINVMKDYGKKVNHHLIFHSPYNQSGFFLQRDWTLNSGEYYMFQIDVKKSDDSLTALELSKQAIEYARELEMIV